MYPPCYTPEETGTYDDSGLLAFSTSMSHLKELNISNNYLKAEGSQILALAIKGNMGVSKLTFSDGDDGYWHSSSSSDVTISSLMTEFSGVELETAGVAVLAAFLPRCKYVNT
jgi:hypothetical protein